MPHNDLKPNYQTEDIKAICPGCEKLVNDKAMKLMSWAQRLREELCKRFMRERRAKFLGLRSNAAVKPRSEAESA